ncbi:hypothetical protein C9374_001438 [Naegleria lovaniensis]|uniref:TauD/TfdA-like domain-containing protein n=1 Tax=Naegleria lovaniensis TaxID=51637 RepID=A0AA88GY73_NAELO|nr:uncharacterized protein C9374_001438 [Naegleria lovaniensis]KAG2387844.1 hypothetical protein C9374_001438 [Naegleria lovaniensis]
MSNFIPTRVIKGSVTYRYGLFPDEGQQQPKSSSSLSNAPPLHTTLPIVIEPNTEMVDHDRNNSSKDSLLLWISQNKSWIRNVLNSSGAILFRGFQIMSAQDFEDVALEAAHYPLQDGYLGTSPRNRVTKYTFTASEFGPMVPIPQHLEMSFLPNSQPKEIFFYCQSPPENLHQGETPICDMRLVYQNLNEEFKRKLDKYQVANVRNYCSKRHAQHHHSLFSISFWSNILKQLDPFRTKPWEDIFETESESQVYKLCEHDQVEPRWKQGKELELYNEHDPIKQVPFALPSNDANRHGEDSSSKNTQGQSSCFTWSNHMQVFHIDAVPCEYRQVAQRQQRWIIYLLWMIALVVILIKKLLVSRHDQAQHAFFVPKRSVADNGKDHAQQTNGVENSKKESTFGSEETTKELELSTKEIQHVSDTIWQNTVFFDWRKGDVMMLNNSIISHGRMPYTQKKSKRVILTAFC